MENRVGFGPRLGAALIDAVIAVVLALVLKGLITSLFPNQLAVMMQWQTADVPPGSPGQGIAAAIAGFSFSMVFLGLLYGLFEAFAGWSPGKLILSLRIVDESGQRAPIGKLLIRYAIKQSSTILAVLSLFLASKPLNITSTVASAVFFFGCFLVLGRARQALHDKIAGTAILRKADVGVTASAAPTPATSL